jgi:hypothetical protein
MTTVFCLFPGRNPSLPIRPSLSLPLFLAGEVRRLANEFCESAGPDAAAH